MAEVADALMDADTPRRTRSRSPKPTTQPPAISDASPGEQRQNNPGQASGHNEAEEESDVYDKLVAEIMENIPINAIKEVQKITKDYASKIMKLQKARERHSKAEKETNEIREGRFPPGTRPYKTNIKDPNMEEIWNKEEKRLVIVIPAGKTINEAKMIVYTQNMNMLKTLDLCAMSKGIDQLYETTGYSSFKEKVQQVCEQAVEGLQKLGLKDTPKKLKNPNKKHIEAKCAKIYDEMTKKLVSKIVDEEEKHKQQKDEKERIEKELANEEPEIRFKKAIMQVIDEKMKKGKGKGKGTGKAKGKGKGTGEGKGPGNYDVDYIGMYHNKSAQECITNATKIKTRRYTKSELSTWKETKGQIRSYINGKGRWGSPEPRKGKGKGKGKRTKGKGKGQMYSKGKGKGKGKAKGKGKGKGKKGFYRMNLYNMKGAKGKGAGKGKSYGKGKGKR